MLFQSELPSQMLRGMAIALIASTLGFQTAEAQSLRKNSTPAEFPPSSYSGNQYVDSNGCVFVRAGVNGATNWVPRVTRERKLVCGFQPSLTAEERSTATKPVEVVQITLEPSEAPAPMPEPVVKAKPEPVRVANVARPVAPAKMSAASASADQITYMQPRTQAVKPTEPQADTKPVVVTRARFAKLPERVFNRKPRRGDIVYEGYVAGDVRVVPRHVYENRGNALVKPPKGYRPVWDDDRLNPQRAEGTFDGKAKMDAIWTQTVPRRLIAKPAG